ncbi:MAG: 2-succinyl-6-hydroxy-2,4-cyclohexadiene-1-carboxylate synthase [bacterium]
MLGDYQFYYSLKGQKEHATILLLHGFMGSSQDWDDVTAGLCDQFCCLSVDLPGHGKTKIVGNEDNYTMENTARALITLLERLKIKKCSLVGYSMGGRLALYCALYFPAYFTKLLIESASPGLKTKKEQHERRTRDNDLAFQLETEDFPAFLKKWYNQSLFKTLIHHKDFDTLMQRRLNNNPQELAKSLKHMGTGAQPPLWKRWARNTRTTLLIVGENDHKFRRIAEDMAGTCKMAQIKVIRNSGHNTHFEKKDTFIEATQCFLSCEA